MFEIFQEKFKIIINTTFGYCEENGLWVGAKGEAGRPMRRLLQGSGQEERVNGTKVTEVEERGHRIC